MREEPVVYINGRPFVLREEERPFKNMQVIIFDGCGIRLDLTHVTPLPMLGLDPLAKPATGNLSSVRNLPVDCTLSCTYLSSCA